MKKNFTAGLLVSGWLLGLTGAGAQNQANQEYQTVAAADLRASPQRFWARGMVFEDDLLTGPARGGITIEGRVFKPVTTREVGVCYLDPDLVAESAGLAVNRRYLFTGSVYQRRRWFHSRYLVLIRSLEPAEDAKSAATNLLAEREGRLENTEEAMRRMTALLGKIEADMQAFARSNRIQVPQLFDPGFKQADNMLDLVRMAVNDAAKKSGLPPAEILSSYLLAVMKQKYASAEIPETAAKAPAAGKPEAGPLAPGKPEAKTPDRES